MAVFYQLDLIVLLILAKVSHYNVLTVTEPSTPSYHKMALLHSEESHVILAHA